MRTRPPEGWIDPTTKSEARHIDYQDVRYAAAQFIGCGLIENWIIPVLDDLQRARYAPQAISQALISLMSRRSRATFLNDPAAYFTRMVINQQVRLFGKPRG